MNKVELLEELDKKFTETKEELSFKVSFKELDDIFSIKDAILGAGFVSENFSRQLCGRIVDTYISWKNYLYGLVVPNPQDLIGINESQLFTDEEKSQLMELLKKLMALAYKSALAGVNKDKNAEKEFIDESVSFWNNQFKPKVAELLQRISES